MPILHRQAALSGANLMIFAGQITGKELLSKFADIDPRRPETSNDWLILDLGAADISEIDFAVLSKLKAIMKPKMTAMKARRDFAVAIVCQRPFNDPIYRTWQSLVGDDPDYPSRPLVFSDLGSACDHLGYAGAQRQEVFELSRAAG
ncbi:MAG TPA: hypothetical protein VGS12_01235 [Caulobacteraceae bacterium]|nr:hypothetical protein [Caulobacteraceae bacterium]